MTQVYNGHNRGGLINFVVVDSTKQLDIWGPRFELTNFVELKAYLAKGRPERLGAMELAKWNRERVMWMPKEVEQNTTFYIELDWETTAEDARGSGKSIWEYVCFNRGIPGAMLFIPTKVLVFTDRTALTMRDHTGEQAMFIAMVCAEEGLDVIHAQIPSIKGVILKGAKQMSDKGYEESTPEAHAAFVERRDG